MFDELSSRFEDAVKNLKGQAKISESARVALFRKDPVFINEHSQQEQPRNGDIPPIPFQEQSHSQSLKQLHPIPQAK